MFASIPSFGLGTFRLQGQTVIDSVATGLDVGYRHIDTAQIYGNEAEVGQAIAASGVARDDIFVTTKVWTDSLTADKLVPSLRASLERLRLGRVDLALIHWPSPGDAVPVAETLQALADAQEQGLADDPVFALCLRLTAAMPDEAATTAWPANAGARWAELCERVGKDWTLRSLLEYLSC